MPITQTTVPTIPVGYFDGYWFEDDHEIACRVTDRPDGKVGIATISIPGTGLQDVGYVVAWARDDEGRVHYAVTDGSTWPEWAATREEAVAKAIEWASAFADPRHPFDLAYDTNIPARRQGDKAELLARIPTN